RGCGSSGASRDPSWIDGPVGRLAEVPPATLRELGLNHPAAGGAYFRLIPIGLVNAALHQAEQLGQPGTFYIHPWELDPGQPRVPMPWLTTIRHYGSLAR